MKSSIELFNHMNDVKTELNQALDMLSQNLQLVEKDLDAWMKLKDFKIEVLVENGVIPTRKVYIEYWEAMKHKREVLNELINDLQYVRDTSIDKGLDITVKIGELRVK